MSRRNAVVVNRLRIGHQIKSNQMEVVVPILLSERRCIILSCVKDQRNKKSVKHQGEIKCLQFLFDSCSRGFVSNVCRESVPRRWQSYTFALAYRRGSTNMPILLRSTHFFVDCPNLDTSLRSRPLRMFLKALKPIFVTL